MKSPEEPDSDALALNKAQIVEHYARLREKTKIWLLVIYIVPLILLSLYFHFQFTITLTESSKAHLKSIAESQRNTIDFFLQERVVNLRNLFESPHFIIQPSEEAMQDSLSKLRQDSPTFVDVGLFNKQGGQLSYAGPYSHLKNKDYRIESWFAALTKGNAVDVISDMYLGFRDNPHFTIAVVRKMESDHLILRATLDPVGFANFINTLDGSKDVYTFIVNAEGYYQSVPKAFGSILERSEYVPRTEPSVGAQEVTLSGETFLAAYSWLHEVRWCLVVVQPLRVAYAAMYRTRSIIISLSILFLMVIVTIIFVSTNKMIQHLAKADLAKEHLQRQLFQAAKLASVGELAAGVAHEINNPLAIIGEEAGLLKDMLNPDLYPREITRKEFDPHLDAIINAAFRGRDITRKLMGFVRKDERNLELVNINDALREVITMMENELRLSTITVKTDFDPTLPEVNTIKNQLQQVFINLINNAISAITPPGTISFRTAIKDGFLVASVADTGCGMSAEQMEKIFFPFYTTKEAGKGTGLGLSVSYGIIKSMGGRIEVRSNVGRGSAFEVMLPVRVDPNVAT